MKKKPRISIEEQMYRSGIWERPRPILVSIAIPISAAVKEFKEAFINFVAHENATKNLEKYLREISQEEVRSGKALKRFRSNQLIYVPDVDLERLR